MYFSRLTTVYRNLITKKKYNKGGADHVRAMNKKNRIATLFWSVIVVAALWYSSVVRIYKNFHEVDPGKFYRSAQLTPEELKEMVKNLGIKTVINLRGEQPDSYWYNDELKAANEVGVRLVSVGFNSKEINAKEAIIEYLETLKTAERPILVHCRSGADRAGEASALYMIEYMGKTKEQALEQLTWKYLHVPFFNPGKTYFIDIYKGLEWVKAVYDPCVEPFKNQYDLKHCPK